MNLLNNQTGIDLAGTDTHQLTRQMNLTLTQFLRQVTDDSPQLSEIVKNTIKLKKGSTQLKNMDKVLKVAYHYEGVKRMRTAESVFAEEDDNMQSFVEVMKRLNGDGARADFFDEELVSSTIGSLQNETFDETVKAIDLLSADKTD